METDLTDTNFKYEKIFKLYVLDWLNNGNIKLFKSFSVEISFTLFSTAS